MAYYVNVAEWVPEQVAEWLRGLDDAFQYYIQYFLIKGIGGHQLLSLTIDDLPALHIEKLGHQELLMAAVDLLREFHYNLDRENLQYIAMQLGCKARSLCSELRVSRAVSTNNQDNKTEQVMTSTLAAVADIIDCVKDLIIWLDRPPFEGTEPYMDIKCSLLKLCLELATIAQRDMFAERPVQVILEDCLQLAKLSDSIVQDFSDPLVVQPASLDVATVKKKPEDDLITNSCPASSTNPDTLDLWVQGMLIQTSFKGVHVVSGVKIQSPAHQCGKIEEGDEIVQVNYQTVVGWQQKKLRAAMLENSTKIILTLKKRPRHSNNFGQIYVKPYRLPSKKREAYNFRWHPECQPQGQGFTPTRLDPLTIPVLEIGQPATAEVAAVELPSETSLESDNDSDDDTFLPSGEDSGNGNLGSSTKDGSPGTASGAGSPTNARLYLPKPRLSIQRRATVTGASPTSSRPPVNIEQFLKEIKREQWTRTPEALDALQRPHSSVGTYNSSSTTINNNNSDNTKRSEIDVNSNINRVADSDILRPKENVGDVHRPATCLGSRTTVEARADLSVKRHFEGVAVPSKQNLLANTIEEKPGEQQEDARSQPPSRKISQDRPKLDKSQSTPAYDTIEKDASIFEEKLNELRTRNKSRVEENAIIEEEPVSPSLELSTSPKPALPPRKDRAPPTSTGSLASPAEAFEATPPVALPAASFTSSPAAIPSQDQDPDSELQPNSAHTLSPHDLGLRPHEVRDLIRRGLWQWHAADGHKGLPALTRVTRLDSNFDPVPGSTVPRIAPSLLVYSTLPRHEEEVHVALPPKKTTTASSSNSDTLSRTGTPVQQTGGRRVACRELGEGDCQGWLHRRRQARGFLSGPRWNKRWFVLKRHTLYGFRDPEDQKAESLIYLPGFSASAATEVKSKKFAFKIFNPGTAFYFACETKEELTKWLGYVSQSATAAYITSNDNPGRDSNPSSPKGSVYYSETEDESLDEGEGSRTGSLGRLKGSSLLSAVNKSPFRAATVGRTKKSSENSSSPVSSPSPTLKSPIVSSLDRKYLRFLRVGQEKQPVPTPQYRSYRKPPSLASLVSPSPIPKEETARFYVNAKPPPRPPSKSKSPSPTKTSASVQETNLDDVFSAASSSRESTHAVLNVRKSVSTSKLGPTLRRGSESATATHGYENVLPQRRSVSRRHSLELSAVKKNSPETKPQPAPRTAKPTGFTKSGSEPPASKESGYARIQPRRSSASEKKTAVPPRVESSGRRSSLSSSRRSSGDATSSVKSGGTSSLPRSPLSPLSPASVSSSRSVFDFQQVEPPREGPADRLWISSLRSNPPPVAPKPRFALRSPPPAALEGTRLKSAACYQPMNFPLSPTSQKEDAKMKLAFEMNLDNSTSPWREQANGGSSAKSTPESKNLFKMFVSPKFARKSPAAPPLADSSPLATPKDPPPKTLLGSPRLHRAIFGSGRDKRKKGESIAGRPSPLEAGDTPTVKEQHQSALGNLGGPDSPSTNQQRPLNRPPPLISPLTAGNFYEDIDSCPGTPRTPLKPAMGVAMIGKQRRTPVTNESFAFSPTLNPSPILSARTPPAYSQHFTYTVPPKTPPAVYPLSLASEATGELEYPPVFEPGSYSLAEKKSPQSANLSNQSLQSTAGAGQSKSRPNPLAGQSVHPVPAPRTKFLINPATGGPEIAADKTSAQQVVSVDIETTTAAAESSA